MIDRKKDSSSQSFAAESSLGDALDKAKKESYDALCDSFNTRQVMLVISDLVGTVNSTNWQQDSKNNIIAAAQWVTEMVNIFGLNGNAAIKSDVIGWTGSSIPEEAKAFVYPLSDLRDELRRKARSAEGFAASDLEIVSKFEANNTNAAGRDYSAISTKFIQDVRAIPGADSKSLSKSVLELCDRLRDVDLMDKGIYLEDSDKANEPALVRPVTKEILTARRIGDQQRRDKLKAKEDREKQAAEEAARKAEKGKINHLTMFRTDEFSAWDEDGIPIKDAEGKDVAKSRGKKLRKDWERQKKLHETWLATQN